MQTPTYRAASRGLLAQATRELDAGDSRQASEKAWGAAAQMVKAVAQDRGWQHDSHPLIFQTGDRLAEETGDDQNYRPCSTSPVTCTPTSTRIGSPRHQ